MIKTNPQATSEDYGNQSERYFQNHCEEMYEIDRIKKVNKSLIQSELIICFSNQTTFLEALALDKPVILMHCQSQHPVNAETSVLFQELECSRIVMDLKNINHNDLYKIVMHPYDWWHTNKVRNARSLAVSSLGKFNNFPGLALWRAVKQIETAI